MALIRTEPVRARSSARKISEAEMAEADCAAMPTADPTKIDRS